MADPRGSTRRIVDRSKALPSKKQMLRDLIGDVSRMEDALKVNEAVIASLQITITISLQKSTLALGFNKACKSDTRDAGDENVDMKPEHLHASKFLSDKFAIQLENATEEVVQGVSKCTVLSDAADVVLAKLARAANFSLMGVSDSAKTFQAMKDKAEEKIKQQSEAVRELQESSAALDEVLETIIASLRAEQLV